MLSQMLSLEKILVAAIGLVVLVLFVSMVFFASIASDQKNDATAGSESDSI